MAVIPRFLKIHFSLELAALAFYALYLFHQKNIAVATFVLLLCAALVANLTLRIYDIRPRPARAALVLLGVAVLAAAFYNLFLAMLVVFWGTWVLTLYVAYLWMTVPELSLDRPLPPTTPSE